LELYVQAFEAEGALDKLEGFASFYGPDFYRLPRNSEMITLVKRAWTIPDSYGDSDISITPLMAGEVLNWKMQ
jgi:dihydroorotase